MVWGLKDAKGLGDFIPEGASFQDYDEKKKDFFENKLTELEREKYINGLASFNSSTTERRLSQAVWLEDYEMPRDLFIGVKPRKLASMFRIVHGFVIVDEHLVHLIQELEPGVHQFWEIEIRFSRSKAPSATYYGLQIQTYLDAFLPDQSRDGSWKAMKSGDFLAESETKDGFGGLVLDSSKVGGRHLWRDEKLKRPNIFMSDLLIERITKSGLRIFPHHQLKTV